MIYIIIQFKCIILEKQSLELGFYVISISIVFCVFLIFFIICLFSGDTVQKVVYIQ